MTTIIARGHQQVHKYELALGGEPRQSAIKRVRSEMSRWLTDRSKKKSAARVEIEAILKKRRERILKQLEGKNSDTKKENAKLKRLFEQRAKRKIVRPVLRKIEPCVVAGSNFAIHAPPYDADWTYNPANEIVDANASNGSYDLGVQSFGDGNEEVAAGVMSWFFCVEAAPFVTDSRGNIIGGVNDLRRCSIIPTTGGTVQWVMSLTTTCGHGYGYGAKLRTSGFARLMCSQVGATVSAGLITTGTIPPVMLGPLPSRHISRPWRTAGIKPGSGAMRRHMRMEDSSVLGLHRYASALRYP